MSEIVKIYNNLKELENEDFNSISPFMGYVYFIEYGDYIKIGSSKQPITRIKSLCSNALRYHDLKIGKIAITYPHTNYKENENILHQHFLKKQKEKTELFNITLYEAIKSIKTIPLVFKDDSQEQEQHSEDFLNNAKQFLLQNVSKEAEDFSKFCYLFKKILLGRIDIHNQIVDVYEKTLNYFDAGECDIPTDLFEDIMCLGLSIYDLTEDDYKILNGLRKYL